MAVIDSAAPTGATEMEELYQIIFFSRGKMDDGYGRY